MSTEAKASQGFDEPATVEPARLDLAAIRARAEAATPGPWEVQGPWPYATIYVTDDSDERAPCKIADLGETLDLSDVSQDPDADFIAHAREDVPALLDEVARLATELRARRVSESRLRLMVGAAECEIARLTKERDEASQLVRHAVRSGFSLESTEDAMTAAVASWNAAAEVKP